MQTRSSRKTEATSYTKLYARFKTVKLNQTAKLNDSDKPETLLAHSQCYFAEGQFISALAGIAQALQHDPAFVAAYCLQSKILDSQGDAVEAVKCLLTALVVGGLSAAKAGVIERLKPYSIVTIRMALDSLPSGDRIFLLEQMFDENTVLGEYCQRICEDKQLEHVKFGLNYCKLKMKGVDALFKQENPVEEFHLAEEIVIPMSINFC